MSYQFNSRNIVFFIVLINHIGFIASEKRETKFIKDDYVCKVEERVKFGYSRILRQGKPSSELYCMSECSKDKQCIGASLDSDNHCYLHGTSPALLKCEDDKDLTHRYWEKYCVQGDWNFTTLNCSCYVGVSGPRCNVYYFKGLRDLVDGGYPDGSYNNILINPLENNSRHPVRLNFLLFLSRTWIVAMNNSGGHFNKTWDEYQHGFKDNSDMWLGLWNWHLISYYGQCRQLFLKLHLTSGELTRYYNNFIVHGPENNYKFDLGTTGTVTVPVTDPSVFGDCLNSYKNTPFSSWDKDNDNDVTKNCASARGSGWWFSGCNNVCNMLGWGIDDWVNTDLQQRLSINNINVGAAKSLVRFMEMYISC